MRNYINAVELLEENAIVNRSDSDILKTVRMWQDQWEEGHVASGPASRFLWKIEPNFPIDRVIGKQDMVQYFEQDQEARIEDGDPDYYSDMINEPIHEPVVLVQIGGLAYPWD